MIRSESTNDQINSLLQKKIIFYDSECILCNKTVLFILKRDKKRIFRFAPIGGDTFKLLELDNKFQHKDSVILIENEKCISESTAVLTILASLEFPWKLASLLTIVPTFIRDGIYRYIAKNRIRFFGKGSCNIKDQVIYASSLLS